MDWLANSLGMNPIKHAWDILCHRVHENQPHLLIFQLLLTSPAWVVSYAVLQADFENLVNSMRITATKVVRIVAVIPITIFNFRSCSNYEIFNLLTLGFYPTYVKGTILRCYWLKSCEIWHERWWILISKYNKISIFMIFFVICFWNFGPKILNWLKCHLLFAKIGC